MYSLDIIQEMVEASFFHPPATLEEMYPALGLFEEAGEVAGKFKKAIRDGGWTPGDEMPPEYRQKILAEMGDVLFYYCSLLNILEADFTDVMNLFREKKNGRVERGTLHGEGDDR